MLKRAFLCAFHKFCEFTDILKKFFFLSDANESGVKKEEDNEGEICVNTLFEETAASSDSQVVYGYDENGNQVSISLVFPGQFEDLNNGNLQHDIHESMQWVGAEEQCVAVSQSNEHQINEKDANSQNLSICEEENDSAIKVYKVDRAARKVFKKFKYAEKRRSKPTKNACKSKGKKSRRIQLIPESEEGKELEYKKKKYRKRKIDTAFRQPSSLHRVNFTGKCSVKIISSDILISRDIFQE